MTRYIAIIGYPLKHTLSPAFQQAALDYYALDIRYQAWEVAPEELGSAISRLRQPENLGANVTVPYKEAVLPLIDRAEGIAAQIGAVNTIAKEKDKLLGYNTDASAFLKALEENGSFQPQRKKVVLLGAGGVARAAAFALAGAGVGSLAIVNRTLPRARKLAADLKESHSFPAKALPWKELPEAVAEAELIVNCTSLGMKHSPGEGQSPLDASLIPSKALVYDLVYNPEETPLLREAKKAGVRTLGGLTMLVYQGAASFEIWIGKKAPLDIMFKAARKALATEFTLRG